MGSRAASVALVAIAAAAFAGFGGTASRASDLEATARASTTQTTGPRAGQQATGVPVPGGRYVVEVRDEFEVVRSVRIYVAPDGRSLLQSSHISDIEEGYEFDLQASSGGRLPISDGRFAYRGADGEVVGRFITNAVEVTVRDRRHPDRVRTMTARLVGRDRRRPCEVVRGVLRGTAIVAVDAGAGCVAAQDAARAWGRQRGCRAGPCVAANLTCRPVRAGRVDPLATVRCTGQSPAAAAELTLRRRCTPFDYGGGGAVDVYPEAINVSCRRARRIAAAGPYGGEPDIDPPGWRCRNTGADPATELDGWLCVNRRDRHLGVYYEWDYIADGP